MKTTRETPAEKPSTAHHASTPRARTLSLTAIPLALGALFVASCSTPSPRRDPEGPQVKQALILHPPSVPAGAATSLDQILDAPTVTAYTVGRTIDPADPSLLHEAHVVYRREGDASWRLQASTTPSVPVRPAGEVRPPAPPDTVRLQELDGVLSELRRTADENRQAIALLFQSIENLARSKASSANPSASVAPTKNDRQEP